MVSWCWPGPPGMGKSRLLGEVLDDARGHGDVVGEGRSLQSASATAFRPLAEALLQARGRSTPLRENGRRVHCPCACGAAVRRGGWPDRGFPAGGLELERGETVLRLLRTLAVEAPLVVGLEDLQWADADTLRVLEYLADNLRERAGAVYRHGAVGACSAAYERLRALKAAGASAVLTLAPLEPSEVTEMVRACWPAIGAAEKSTGSSRLPTGCPFWSRNFSRRQTYPRRSPPPSPFGWQVWRAWNGGWLRLRPCSAGISPGNCFPTSPAPDPR